MEPLEVWKMSIWSQLPQKYNNNSSKENEDEEEKKKKKKLEIPSCGYIFAGVDDDSIPFHTHELGLSCLYLY